MKTDQTTAVTPRRRERVVDEHAVDPRAEEALDALDRLMRQMFSDDFLRMKAESFVDEVLEHEDADPDEFDFNAGRR